MKWRRRGMDLGNLKLFSLMGKRMAWLTQRQQVLAHNIANSDTPGYRPHDLKAQNFSKFLRPTTPKTAMRTTTSNHMEPTRKPPRFRSPQDRENYEVAPAGNAVVLEEQLVKVSETQGGYRLATNLYQKHLSMIRTAIGRDR